MTGIIVGRFQPLTKGHMKHIDRMIKENEHNILFLVKGKKTSLDKNKNPFKEELQKKLIKEVYNNIEIITIPSAYFIDIINEMKEDKFRLYVGEDRKEQYKSFKKYLKNKDMDIITLDRNDNISATRVRKALKADNFKEFKNLIATPIHKYYKELKDNI